jgi:hypothetical protein
MASFERTIHVTFWRSDKFFLKWDASLGYVFVVMHMEVLYEFGKYAVIITVKRKWVFSLRLTYFHVVGCWMHQVVELLIKMIGPLRHCLIIVTSWTFFILESTCSKRLLIDIITATTSGPSAYNGGLVELPTAGQPPECLFAFPSAAAAHGCQIFLGAIYRNGENICTKWPQYITNGYKIYQIAVKFSNWP